MNKSLSAPFRHVQTPVEIFDYWLPILGHVELKVLMIIVRQTFGWHKIKDRISISQLVEKTGSNRTRVCEAIQVLIDHNLVKKELVGGIGNQQTTYELIFEDKKEITSTESVPPQYQNGTPPSTKLVPTKETLTKDTLSKEKETMPSPSSSPSSDSYTKAQSHSDAQARETVPFKKRKKTEEALEKEKHLKDSGIEMREDVLGYLAHKHTLYEILDALKKFDNLKKKNIKMRIPIAIFRSLLDGNIAGVPGQKAESNIEFFCRFCTENEITHLFHNGVFVTNSENNEEISFEIDKETFNGQIFKWM